MAKKTAPLLPAAEESLRRLGERLRTARLRRRLTASQVAERAGMSPMTLRGLEAGGAGVTIGAYVSVLQVLGMASDIDLVAKHDIQGQEIQDSHLPPRRRRAPPPARSVSPQTIVATPAPDPDDWVEACAAALMATLPDGLPPSECWKAALQMAQVPSTFRLDPREAAADFVALRESEMRLTP